MLDHVKNLLLWCCPICKTSNRARAIQCRLCFTVPKVIYLTNGIICNDSTYSACENMFNAQSPCAACSGQDGFYNPMMGFTQNVEGLDPGSMRRGAQKWNPAGYRSWTKLAEHCEVKDSKIYLRTQYSY